MDMAPAKVIFDKNLEGLRGLCAITVALTHVLIYEFFCTGGISLKFVSSYLGFAHEAVLIFFIISGYVIGAQHIRAPFNYPSAMDYLKKRAVRLYPIYILAVLLSFFIHFPAYFSPGALLGHLFFTQVFLVNTVSSNVVLWSLGYEVAYYLLFLGLWATGKRNPLVCVILSVVIFVFALATPALTVLLSLLLGWIFWMTGLWLSQQPKRTPSDESPYKSFISYFALVLAIHNLEVREYVVRFLHHRPEGDLKIGMVDVVLLPVCALIVIEVTDTRVSFLNSIKVLCYLVPACYIAILLYYHHSVLTNTYWEFGMLFFLTAVLALPLKMDNAKFEKLNYTGSISYALYVFHFPVAVFLNIYLGRVLFGIPLYVIGFFSWAVLTVGLSVLTEKIMQPYIKTAILKRH